MHYFNGLFFRLSSVLCFDNKILETCLYKSVWVNTLWLANQYPVLKLVELILLDNFRLSAFYVLEQSKSIYGNCCTEKALNISTQGTFDFKKNTYPLHLIEWSI